jgi:hypothetical protein
MASPVTSPEELPIVATPELLLQTPPDAVSLRVVVLPTHTPPAPVIVPAPGVGFTVPIVVLVPNALQPFASVTDKVYIPLAAVVADRIEGLWLAELNEFGPLQV